MFELSLLNSGNPMKSIFLVEDEIIVAKDMERLLCNAGYQVAGIASTYQKAKEKLQYCSPDLILCDINLNCDKDGLDLMSEVQTEYPIPFIFVSAYSDLPTLQRANDLHPENYITKPFTESQLLTSIQLVLARQVEQGPPTVRELSILREIAQGKSTKEIADILDISINTVETHRKNLLRKYRVNTSPELVGLAASQNWLHTSTGR